MPLVELAFIPEGELDNVLAGLCYTVGVTLTITEFARMGGNARAKKLSKKRLSEIGKMGGRPRKKKRRLTQS